MSTKIYDYSLELTFGYTNTDFQRTYKIEDISESALENVKAKILAINAALAGGTDGGLAEFFRADDYDDSDPNNVIGKFRAIVDAQAKIIGTEIISKRIHIYTKEA